jgi:putative tricarboxylic transport membrane protein
MHMQLSRFSIYTAIVVAACGSIAQPALAQKWQPGKNVEIVVGADPGGSLDFTARLLHSIWRERKILDGVVMNKAGAGNAIAWTYLNQHPGDGHYAAIATPNLFTNQILGVSPMSHRDVTPLAVVLTEYTVVIVRPDSPLKSMKDIVAPLRKDAGALSIGMSPGIGSPAYTAAGISMKEAGVDAKNLRLITYKSAGNVVTALLGGEIDIAYVAAPNVPPLLAANRVRTLAITAPQRITGPLSNTPTLKDQGIDAVFENFRGMIGPRDLKPEQIAFWENALLQATKSPQWQSALEKNGWGDRYLDNAGSKRFFEEQFAKYKAIYTDLGKAK